MSRSLNRVQLIGYLGQDPETRCTNSGTAVATFSVATSESWKDGEGNAQEKTEWHNIVVWKKLAEVCAQYLKKGSRAYLEGRIQSRSYDDKNGVKRYVYEIVVDRLLMLDSKKSVDTSDAMPEDPSRAAAGGAAPHDDLPF